MSHTRTSPTDLVHSLSAAMSATAAAATTAAAAKVDTVIIGAGVIGLAVARALVVGRGHGEVLVLDRAGTVGSETSSRNSEVVHAGLYYPPHSLKAQLCVRGRHQLYDYCHVRHIAHQRCGKLIVATDPRHMATLSHLQKQAADNAVFDAEILTPDQVWAREPSLTPNLLGALWSPSTGILDSHSFMQHLVADAEDGGNFTLALHTPVHDAAVIDNRICICAGDMWLSCARVINCAGLWAGQIASLFHNGAAQWQPPRQYYARGTYFRLQQQQQPQRPIFSHLIYPVPDPRGGLGVHATLDLQGLVRFGPDVEWLDAAAVDDPDGIDLAPDPARADAFYESIRSYWPDLRDGALSPDYVGVRPKLQHPALPSMSAPRSMSFQDFVIAGPETHGVPGLVHLFGMESPGLTSSMAIADYVATLVGQRQQRRL